MKTYVITLSQNFPATHKKAGQATFFKDKFHAAITHNDEYWNKLHTIRANYELWRKRFEQIERTEYGKQIRKQYENHEVTEQRKNIQQLEPRTDGVSNYGKVRDDIVTKMGDERYPESILHFTRDTQNGQAEAIHPTQKPVDLLRYLIRTYSNEGDTILDNCMGSGTTAVACIKEKRHFIGFELNKQYFDKACQRIDAERRQLSLF